MKLSFRLPLVVSAAILSSVVSIGLAQPAAQKTDAKADAAAKADAKPAKPRAKPRGRLPGYYSAVIDGQQREKIYAIQQEYAPKISALQAELKALQDKRDAEVEAVLTPTQRDAVAKLAEQAKQKRRGGASAKAAAGDSKATATSGK